MRVVLLGTGTGVGKTYVTTLLAGALVGRGVPVLALKPVETGLRRRDGQRAPRGSDARALEDATGRAPSPHPLYAFERPVSPHLAARQERRPISLARLARWVELQERTNGMTSHVTSLTLIESAGAALSPVGPRTTNLDLATCLDAERWVLVAPDALGVLHDVRATWSVLAARGRAPDHLVLCAAREPDDSTGTNAAELPRVGLPRPIAVVPRGATDARALAPLVRALLAVQKQTRGRKAPRMTSP